MDFLKILRNLKFLNLQTKFEAHVTEYKLVTIRKTIERRETKD